MKVRITFRSEIFFDGETIEDVAKQWLTTPLFNTEAISNNGADFLEIVSVEDAETSEDLDTGFNNAF